MRMGFVPSERKTSSNGPQYLASRSWMRNRSSCSESSRNRFLPCWVTHAESGFAVTPPRWTRLVASSMKNSTESAFRAMVSTVKKSEARMAPGLSPQERRPRWPGAPGGRTKPVRLEQPPHRRGTDADAELSELALDPHAPPPRVLPRQAKHEVPDFWIDRGPSRPARAVGPLPPDELPVPPEQGLRGDQERRPARSRHEA